MRLRWRKRRGTVVRDANARASRLWTNATLCVILIIFAMYGYFVVVWRERPGKVEVSQKMEKEEGGLRVDGKRCDSEISLLVMCKGEEGRFEMMEIQRLERRKR